MGCLGDPSAGGTVSAAPSSETAVRRHRRGDRLIRAIEDPFDLSANAMLEDTEDLKTASAVAAHLHALHHWRKRAHGSRVHRRPRYVGSVPGRRPNTRRNFRSGLRAILRDYFGLNGEPPVCNEGDFERRFRVPRSVFLRIYNAVKDRPLFAQRINATGRLQAHPLRKVVADFRVIAYGEAPDRTDEYVRVSASIIAMSVRELILFIVDEFGPSYLRPPPLKICSAFRRAMQSAGCPGAWAP